jgi:AcrR family transcriptional regulator
MLARTPDLQMAAVNKLKRAKVPNRTKGLDRPETPAPTEGEGDRRVRRTRQTLHEALIELVLEKGFDAITIKELVARADVGRSTLYAHHGGKEGLLRDGLMSLRTRLLAEQRAAFERPPGAPDRLLGYSGAFFAHVHEYRQVFHALVHRGGAAIVMDGLRRLLTDVVQGDVLAVAPSPRAGAMPREAVTRFVVDGFVAVTLWWLEQSPQTSPAEVNAIFRRLALPALKSAGLP